MYCAMHVEKGQVSTDQTGRFLTPATDGTQYLLIFYHYDSNFIHAQGMPNRLKESHVAAYKIAHALFTKGD